MRNFSNLKVSLRWHHCQRKCGYSKCQFFHHQSFPYYIVSSLVKVQATAFLAKHETLTGNSGGVGKSGDKDLKKRHTLVRKWILHKIIQAKKRKQLTEVGDFVQIMSC